MKNAKKFADALGYPLVLMHKQRPEHSVSEVTHVIGELAGKTPILLDDMVDGGGSACGARAALANYPIRDEVYLCTTHAVFSGSAVEKLNAENFAEIIMTNSLPVDPLPEKATPMKWSSLCAQKNKGLWQKFGVLSLAGCGAVVTGSCLDILKNVKTATPQKPLQALTDPTIMLRRGT